MLGLGLWLGDEHESHVPYQQMIRKVLDNYTEIYSR
jgi:hypothetical protein